MTKAQQTRVARLMPNGIPKWIRCYDNGGRSIDNFTVVFTGRYTHKTGGEHWVLAMNAAPFHPQGFGQHASYQEQVDTPWPPSIGHKNHLGVRIKFTDLPEDCQQVVLTDYCNLWDIARQ